MRRMGEGIGQKIRRRLRSGMAIQIALLVLLPVVILSFTTLSQLRKTPDWAGVKPVAKVVQPVVRTPAPPETTPTAEQTESPPDQTKTASPTPPEAQTKKQNRAAPSQQARTESGAPIQTAAPVWKSLSENWDQARPSNAPQLKSPAGKEPPWRQLNLGQSEEVNVAKGDQAPAIAAIRKSPLEAKQEQQKPTPPAAKTKTTTPPPPAKTAAAAPPAQPETSARLAIVNHSGRPEMGMAYRDVIRIMGFPLAQIIPREARRGATQVYYQPDSEILARRIYDRLPGKKTIQPISWKSTFDVVIVIQRETPGRFEASGGT